MKTVMIGQKIRNPDLRGSTVLVTGGVGFIGSHLCESLIAAGAQVAVVDNHSAGNEENSREADLRGEIHEMDVRSDEFASLIRESQFDAVFHLAGSASVPLSVEDPAYDLRNNLVATFHLLETIRKAALNTRLIMVSSAAVYGNPERLPMRETDRISPVSPYGVSKLAAERYVEVYSRLYGLKAASVRPFSAFGPRLRKQIVFDLIHKAYGDPERLEILGDGTQIRDFVYVTDIVRAMLIVLEKAPLNGEVYNVASGRGYSIKQIAATIVRAIGIAPEISYTGHTRPGDTDKWIASIDKIAGLGYRPAVSLEEGIRRTVEWYVQNEPETRFSLRSYAPQ